MSAAKRLPNCLLMGTGEYTTGYVHGGVTGSDKRCGVVALVFFDLRARGLVGEKIGLCGTNGTKFPGLRSHLKAAIEDKYSLPVECDTFPADDVKRDVEAYKAAIKTFQAGDICVITTPDDTHYNIAVEAMNHGMHIMCTKPLVKTLKQHRELAQLAREKGVIACLEFHKRYDPMYNDACNRIQELGDFGFWQSYMSQPKTQLQTFKSWAGISSDISYYLNSHHIDIHEWAMHTIACPTKVTAMAANGVLENILERKGEDTITLCTQWDNYKSRTQGVAVYTASWSTPLTDVHSEQKFMYLGHKGQLKIDQGHRGFHHSSDTTAYASINPLYMRYTPDKKGRFCGQEGYGYKSFSAFVACVGELLNDSSIKASDYDEDLPVAQTTMQTTAILEAGRISLDNDGKAVKIMYDDDKLPVSLVVVETKE